MSSWRCNLSVNSMKAGRRPRQKGQVAFVQHPGRWAHSCVHIELKVLHEVLGSGEKQRRSGSEQGSRAPGQGSRPPRAATSRQEERDPEPCKGSTRSLLQSATGRAGG